ncbi:hypothetical protein B0H19DRAFT_1057107 [Mycena capillaripes]|nr:hypothetical protein B0H19DRAFT_1057107 [Mycena capillaripes]
MLSSKEVGDSRCQRLCIACRSAQCHSNQESFRRNYPVSSGFLPHSSSGRSNIPNIPDLDDEMVLPSVSSSIRKAVASLHAIYLLNTPPAAYPDLWAPHLHSHCETVKLIDSTPGVRVFVAKTWGILLEKGPSADGFEDLGYFFGRDEAISDFSHFFRLHEMGIFAGFRCQICAATHFKTCYMGFYRALISHGIVAALIAAVNALDEVFKVNVAQELEGCFILLDWIFHVGDRRDLVAESIQAGLVRDIISCALHHRLTSDTLQCIRTYLTVLIPESLMYHSVLSKIKVPTVADEALERFMESGIYAECEALESLVDDRCGVLTWFNSVDYESYRACDNMVVGDLILDSAIFDHRQVRYDPNKSRIHALLRLFDHVLLLERVPETRLVRGSSSFIRASFDDDYTQAREEIFRNQISFLRVDPSAQFYLLLHHTGGNISIDVKPVSDNPGFSAEQWDDYVSWNKNSGGRMELHVWVIGSGPQASTRMVPMRSNSSRIHEELIRIAGSVDLDDLQLNEEIEQLIIEQDEEVLLPFFDLIFKSEVSHTVVRRELPE